MEFLTKKEIAEQLKVHPNTIDRWRKKGMPCVKYEETIRFNLEEVVEWLKKNSEE